MSALKTDFRPVESEYRRGQEEETKQKEEEQHRKEQEQLWMQQAKDQFDRERKEAIEAAMNTLADAEQEALLAAFLLEGEGNPFFQKLYAQNGLKNPFLQGQRNNFLAKKLLPERLHSLEHFVAFHHHIEVEKQAELK